MHKSTAIFDIFLSYFVFVYLQRTLTIVKKLIFILRSSLLLLGKYCYFRFCY